MQSKITSRIIESQLARLSNASCLFRVPQTTNHPSQAFIAFLIYTTHVNVHSLCVPPYRYLVRSGHHFPVTPASSDSFPSHVNHHPPLFTGLREAFSHIPSLVACFRKSTRCRRSVYYLFSIHIVSLLHRRSCFLMIIPALSPMQIHSDCTHFAYVHAP